MAWRMIGEAVQRAMDEARADGASSACIGVGEIVANVRASRSESVVEATIVVTTTIAAVEPKMPTRQEELEAGSQVLLDELDQAA